MLGFFSNENDLSTHMLPCSLVCKSLSDLHIERTLVLASLPTSLLRFITVIAVEKLTKERRAMTRWRMIAAAAVKTAAATPPLPRVQERSYSSSSSAGFSGLRLSSLRRTEIRQDGGGRCRSEKQPNIYHVCATFFTRDTYSQYT